MAKLRTITLVSAIALAASVRAQEPATNQGELWDLDQIQIPLDVPEARLDALQPDHSLDAVVKTLTGLGIAFKRVHIRILADRLPPKLKEALLALPKGEPFVLPDPDFWAVSVIVGRILPPGAVRYLTPARPALAHKA